MAHKKIIAFLQLYNEHEKGNLTRCLENCKQWSDEIVIYDDCSTDGSLDIYLKYTERSNIIVGQRNEFGMELYHKNELLKLALSKDPDFIGWMDGDDIFDKYLTEDMQGLLNNFPNVDGLWLHNLNLWRSDSYYRIDSEYNGLDKVSIWRNNGKLHYEPTSGLHKIQTPKGIETFDKLGHTLIHYGFSSEDRIVRKYLDYKGHGQDGWALDRLIYEDTLYLVKVPKEIYPTVNIPVDYDTAEKPTPITFNEYRNFKSWDEYVNSRSSNL